MDSLKYIQQYNSGFKESSVNNMDDVIELIMQIDMFSSLKPVIIDPDSDIFHHSNYIKGISLVTDSHIELKETKLIQLTALEPLKFYIGLSEQHNRYSDSFTAYFIVDALSDYKLSTPYLREIQLTGLSKLFGKPSGSERRTQAAKELAFKAFLDELELNFLRKINGYKDLSNSLSETQLFLQPYFDSNKLNINCFGMVDQGCHYYHNRTYSENHSSSIFRFIHIKIGSVSSYLDNTYHVSLDNVEFKDEVNNIDKIINQIKSLSSPDNHEIKIKQVDGKTNLSFATRLKADEIVKFLDIIFSLK